MAGPYAAWEIAQRYCEQCHDTMLKAWDDHIAADRRGWSLMRESTAVARSGDALRSYRLNADAQLAFKDATAAHQRYLKAKDEFAAAIRAARDVLPLEAQEKLFDWEHKVAQRERRSPPAPAGNEPTRH